MNNEKAIELLKENEWSTINFCDVCANHKRKGHKPVCWVAQLLALLAEPEKPHGWIPVSEGLPDDKQYILVIAEQNKISGFGFWDKDGKYLNGQRGRIDFRYITHWKPIILPEPEKGGE